MSPLLGKRREKQALTQLPQDAGRLAGVLVDGPSDERVNNGRSLGGKQLCEDY